MRIAIAANKPSIDGDISDRAARAPYILIFEDGELVETIKNPFAVGGGGAGWSVAYLLGEKNVDLFVAERIGPNMQRALEEQGIKYRAMTGKIRDALKS